MEKNLRTELSRMMNEGRIVSLPILSFPSAELIGVSVRELVTDSALQADGMCAIAERCDTAAAVGFMDLSVEAECFGAEVRFSDDEVPTVTGRLINDESEAEALEVPEVGSARSGIFIEAIKLAGERITDRPILGGMIGPFSLAARLLDVSEIMIDCYDDPDMVHTVLEKATEFLIGYAKAFASVGADGILLAEPVAGLLSPTLEEEFSSPYVKRIFDAVKSDGFAVIYHNCGDNTPLMLDSILTVGADAYHFGNSIDMKTMLEKIPSDIPVMGNIDPAGILRRGTPVDVKNAVTSLLKECGGYKNFMISSGCDIPPQTPWENLDAYFAAVGEYYGK